MNNTPVISIQESVVTAMDGQDVDLYPYLPYILQDVWEIGSDPQVMADLVRKHGTKRKLLNVLDLGCGKGAVSVTIAKELGFYCHGIDAVLGFIEFAINKADELQVSHLCKFEVNDIRKRIKSLPTYDVIILGAVGPVFGNYLETLRILHQKLTKNGIILIDDGFIDDDSPFSHLLMSKWSVVKSQIKEAGMQLVDESIISKENIASSDDYIFENITRRCKELMLKHPDKKAIFQNYIKRQEEENEVLENKVTCSTLVLKKSSF